MYIKWLTFSCDLPILYPAVHFLSMWLSGIMAIIIIIINIIIIVIIIVIFIIK